MWPGGDAPGGQGEPAALPRGLRSQWLGALEPLQPGESWRNKRLQLSRLAQKRYGDVRLVWSPLRFIARYFSCHKHFLWGSKNSKQHCITLSSVWIVVNRLFLVHQGGIKAMNTLGGRLIYHLYSTLLSVCSAGKEGNLWWGLRNSWAGFHIYTQNIKLAKNIMIIIWETNINSENNIRTILIYDKEGGIPFMHVNDKMSRTQCRIWRLNKLRLNCDAITVARHTPTGYSKWEISTLDGRTSSSAPPPPLTPLIRGKKPF